MKAGKKQTILITGISGALASRVAEKLMDRYKIIGVDFKESSEPVKDIVFYKLDFSKRGFEAVFKKHKIDGVIHLGRILIHQTNRYRRYNTNVLGTQNLLDLSLKYGIKQVLILSTYHVYGANAYNPTLLDEQSPLKASNNSADLADAIELDTLSMLYMLRHPNISMTVLRPCNVVGPGVKNSMSLLLKRKLSPCLLGFSPIMQFIHVEDLADAIELSYILDNPGIYNVATDDWVPYQTALRMSGCVPVSILHYPSAIPKFIANVLSIKEFPSYLLDYYKYPVVLDGSLFKKTFDFNPKHSLEGIFTYYRELKT